MHQTKESHKRAPVHLPSIYILAFSNVLLVGLLVLNCMVYESSYCKCSTAWCQVRTSLLFTIWAHPLQMREYPLWYAGTDRKKNPTLYSEENWKTRMYFRPFYIQGWWRWYPTQNKTTVAGYARCDLFSLIMWALWMFLFWTIFLGYRTVEQSYMHNAL